MSQQHNSQSLDDTFEGLCLSSVYAAEVRVTIYCSIPLKVELESCLTIQKFLKSIRKFSFTFIYITVYVYRCMQSMEDVWRSDESLQE